MKRTKEESYFHEYFKEWVELYKVGAVRAVTLQKYVIAHEKILELAPFLTMKQLDRKSYQKLLNDYAQTHEKQTTLDFHHQIKGAILDSLDDGVIKKDPTRKVVIKGKSPTPKKAKFLNQYELRLLLNQLSLTDDITYDWMILLIAKTGIRFSEALGITPEDFDFAKQTLFINKNWDYKSPAGGFQPTKNVSSTRRIQLDWQTAMQFSQLVSKLDPKKPILSLPEFLTQQ